MAKIRKRISEHLSGLRREILTEMLKLSTAGFGLVAALAWNELIKEVVEGYIKPVIGGASGLISLLIYAVLITLLAVFITYNLTKLVKKD